ncbi:MAG: hypothetical protein ABIW76_16070 [Fibrobacteria bacterium]
MLRVRYQIFFLIASCICAPLRAQPLDPLLVRFSAITVPPQSVRLDSTRGALRFYSGELTYNLATDYDSVPVHVYFEEVPVQKTFLIQREDSGRAAFVRIDSMCSGDLGWVKPSQGLRVRWRYSTANSRNHCRLKVGMANLEYLVAYDSSKSGGFASRHDFAYNRLGLPVRWMVGTETVDYAYNRFGFPLFAPPYIWTRYDSLSRRIYYQYGQGANLQAIFGYTYDSLSRLNEIQHLPGGYPMEAPGPPFNREVFRLDNRNRVVYKEAKLEALQFMCNPQFTFKGTDRSFIWYYENSAGEKIDSTVREHLDSTKVAPLLVRITTVTRRNRDSQLMDELETFTGFDTAPGSCFAPAYNSQTRYDFQADSQGWPAKTVVWFKTASETAFAPVDTLCSPREYDATGRILHSMFNCADTVGSSWTYDSYGFIKTQRSGTVNEIFERRLYDLDTLEAFAPQ